jgi:hypothetical protein
MSVAKQATDLLLSVPQIIRHKIQKGYIDLDRHGLLAG